MWKVPVSACCVAEVCQKARGRQYLVVFLASLFLFLGKFFPLTLTLSNFGPKEKLQEEYKGSVLYPKFHKY